MLGCGKRPRETEWRVGIPRHANARGSRVRESGRWNDHRRTSTALRRLETCTGPGGVGVRREEPSGAIACELMFVLFDQNTPVAIAKSLPGHLVKTARQQGWDTLANGDLLRVAEEAGFDILLTADQNLPISRT